MSSLKKHLNRKTPCDIDIKKEVKQKEDVTVKEDLTVKEDVTVKENNDIKIEIDVKNEDGLTYLASIDDNSIDLILTDPPYIISKDTGMDKHYNKVKENEKNNIEFMKTEEEWDEYKKTLDKPKSELDDNKGPGWSKENYLKYGTILGKKYCSKTQYGEWDNNFTIDDLEKFIEQYYKKLRRGGTLIIWFDLWKITTLKDVLEKYKFKQIRFIEWIKTNPLPINSKINYLTNSREIALLAIKDSNPTFNSSYDNGIYQFPMASGKNKFHPTQKNLELFEKLIEKHSNENDTVLDTFLGGGTTAIACKNKKRNFKGCEINKEYVDKINQICF
jgi:DNA modification methylase